MNHITRRVTALLAAAALTLPAAASAQTETAPDQAPASAGAQPAAAPQQHHGHGWRKLLSQLNLSDAQKQQIQSIVAAARAKNQNVTDPQTRHDNMRAAMAQIKGVLTPDQQTQLKSLRQAARAQRLQREQSAPQATGKPG
jgi:Spy/CpxP family protein refolding chaperone